MSSPTLRQLIASDLSKYGREHLDQPDLSGSESRGLGCVGMDSLALIDFVGVVSQRRGLVVDDARLRRFVDQNRRPEDAHGYPSVGQLLDFLVTCKT